ncbi:MAG TPA: DUF3772 domain-containing protein [Methylobacter sp.]|jgi:small-conductance mechanosensitive channel
MKFKLFLAFCLFFNMFPYALCAQSDQEGSIPQLLLQWNADLEQSSKALASPDLDDDALKHLREHLNELRNDALSARDKITSEISHLHDELTALGLPPGKDAPNESASIATKRKVLNDQLTIKEGQIKEAGLIISSADETLDQLSALRIHRFTKKTFSRGLSALAPEVWQKGIPNLQEKLNGVKNQFETWQSEETDESLKRMLLHLSLTLMVILAVVWPFARWFSKKFGRTTNVQIPTYVELFRAALAVTFVRILLPMSITVSTYLLLDQDLHWQGVVHDFAFSMLKAFLMIILATAVSRAILAPFNGRWRLMPLNDADACYVHKTITGLAWVFAVDLVLDDWLSSSGASLELIILRKFLVGLLIAGLLLALLIRRQLWRMDIQHRRKKSEKSTIWRGLRALIGVLVLMIPVSAIAGYVALSRLLGSQIVLTGGLYILVGVIIALCTELIEELLSKETELGLKIRQKLELTDGGGELLVFWLKAAVNSVIYISAILTLLVIWGAGGEDLNAWLYTALFGFNVGGVAISITTIFLAIAFFSGILLLTRLLQRFLKHVILPRTLIDFGVQNSIRASVGYIGFIIAAGVAISTLGIDLSKLAIIVGALSVGIGFGLQNIVNNFVSGLILLIERPIKVGDWVVVNDQQGYVKNINVRATEIQTFDRASVFIPNSNLISNPLLNWTYADKTGRIIIPVGVAYGTDTRKVQTILLEVAAAHPSVFNSPEPSVLFKSFGDSCLNFELRAFVQDVDKVMTVNSDLCFEIDAVFRKEGIEIPYPQQDVHWRDIERLEKLVSKILTEKKS